MLTCRAVSACRWPPSWLILVAVSAGASAPPGTVAASADASAFAVQVVTPDEKIAAAERVGAARRQLAEGCVRLSGRRVDRQRGQRQLGRHGALLAAARPARRAPRSAA